jgi:hypothetical protein
MSERPAIPEELRRRVLVESGHRCAIPSCRQIVVEVHHIVPWEQCRTHEYSNLIALCPNCHSMAHKNVIDRKSLHLYKANLRFTHDRFSQVEVDLLFECARQPDSCFYVGPVCCSTDKEDNRCWVHSNNYPNSGRIRWWHDVEPIIYPDNGTRPGICQIFR